MTKLEDAMSTEMATKAPPRSVGEYLKSREYQREIALALPEGWNVERFMRFVTTAVKKVPKLMDCVPASFGNAVLDCAATGLEPNTPLGHAYLIPRAPKRGEKPRACFEIGYKGFVDLLMETGLYSGIECEVVCENDIFSEKRGSERQIIHHPERKRARGEPYAVYAIVYHVDGGMTIDVMGYDEVMKVKQTGYSGSDGPWNTWEEEMWKKTVLKRISKKLKLRGRAEDAVRRENMSVSAALDSATIEAEFTKADVVKGRAEQKAAYYGGEAEQAPAGDETQQQGGDPLSGAKAALIERLNALTDAQRAKFFAKVMVRKRPEDLDDNAAADYISILDDGEWAK